MTIIFTGTLYPNTDISIGEFIFFVIAFILIYGGIFIIAFFVGIKNYMKKIPFKNNNVFLNTFVILTISFFLFELYYIKYRFIIFPKDGIYGDAQIITDDKGFNIGNNIAFIHNCSNKLIEKNLKGRIHVIVKNINLSDKTNISDTIYKTEILYTLNDEEKELKYYTIEFDKDCKELFQKNEETKERKNYLLKRAEQNENEIKKYEKYLK